MMWQPSEIKTTNKNNANNNSLKIFSSLQTALYHSIEDKIQRISQLDENIRDAVGINDKPDPNSSSACVIRHWNKVKNSTTNDLFYSSSNSPTTTTTPSTSYDIGGGAQSTVNNNNPNATIWIKEFPNSIAELQDWLNEANIFVNRQLNNQSLANINNLETTNNELLQLEQDVTILRTFLCQIENEKKPILLHIERTFHDYHHELAHYEAAYHSLKHLWNEIIGSVNAWHHLLKERFVSSNALKIMLNDFNTSLTTVEQSIQEQQHLQQQQQQQEQQHYQTATTVLSSTNNASIILKRLHDNLMIWHQRILDWQQHVQLISTTTTTTTATTMTTRRTTNNDSSLSSSSSPLKSPLQLIATQLKSLAKRIDDHINTINHLSYITPAGDMDNESIHSDDTIIDLKRHRKSTKAKQSTTTKPTTAAKIFKIYPIHEISSSSSSYSSPLPPPPPQHLHPHFTTAASTSSSSSLIHSCHCHSHSSPSLSHHLPHHLPSPPPPHHHHHYPHAIVDSNSHNNNSDKCMCSCCGDDLRRRPIYKNMRVSTISDLVRQQQEQQLKRQSKGYFLFRAALVSLPIDVLFLIILLLGIFLSSMYDFEWNCSSITNKPMITLRHDGPPPS